MVRRFTVLVAAALALGGCDLPAPSSPSAPVSATPPATASGPPGPDGGSSSVPNVGIPGDGTVKREIKRKARKWL